MHSYIRFLLIGLLSVGLLTACGGGDDPPITDRDNDSTDNGGGDGGDGDGSGGGGGGGTGSGSGISYLPLAVLEASRDFSGYSSDNLFQGAGEAPLIDRFLINPISASTFEPVSTAVASDYKVTVDGVEIEAEENFPLLQPVLGNRIYLRTALVFDLSNSVNHIDVAALVNEAKAYIAAAQAHSDEIISNQQYVIWAFATQVDEVTAGFTDDSTVLNNALDDIVTRYNSKTMGTSSNLHRAVVEAIGRFQASENGVDYDFRDSSTAAADNNDLIDIASADGVLLSHLVVFSSGSETGLAFTQETMVKAIESQAFLQYDRTAAVGSNTMRNLKKPVFYYVVGRNTPGITYSALSAQSERTTNLLLNGGVYSFSSGLISNQLAAIAARIDVDNQYLYRYVFLPRVGDHTTVFSSNATGFNYSLTSQYDNDNITGVPDATPTVEITGPNGEYISGRVTGPGGEIILGGTLAFTAPITLRPATRWSPDSFGPADYNWAVTGGTMTGTANGDGSYTVTSVTGAATLQLTNTVIGQSVELELTN